jgi:predicted metalloprotease with PDZ domain
MTVEGMKDLRSSVKIHLPNPTWSIVTAMPLTDLLCGRQYEVLNFEDLIDHPFEIGQSVRQKCMVEDRAHYVHVHGHHYGNLMRLTEDVQKICTKTARLFGGVFPMQEYHFILDVVTAGYGGLEHRASTMMNCSRDALSDENSPGYQSLLGLFSHEYFHAWWIKRVKPASFIPYRLDVPSLSAQLWIYEGFTAYYDDLILVRAQVISVDQYLNVVSQNISKYLQTPGRLKQSVRDASIDAWINDCDVGGYADKDGV